MSNEKNTFADNSRVEPTIFLMEKLSISMKLYSGHFYGQSFIKTVRGPLDVLQSNHCYILSSVDMSCRPWVEIIHMKMFANTIGAHITVN